MSAPDLFDFDDDGVAQPVKQPSTDGEEDLARNAALSCPEQAIKIEQ